MAGWQTIKLSDVVRTNVSTYSLSDNWEFVNYLDTGNIVANEIALIQRIELAQGEKLPSRARRKVEIGDIIYSTVRPNQLHYGFIDNIPENFLVSTGFAVLHPEKGKIDAKFLYYLLVQNDITEKLQAIAEQSTSTYPSIKPSDIEDLDFIVPEIKAQRKISNILSAIDKKIELNTQINHNLEEQAKALYDQIWDNYDSGTWSSAKAEDLFDISIGKTPPRKESQWFSENDNDIVWVSIADMGQSGCFISNSSEYLTPDAVSKFNVKRVPAGAILLSFKLTVGRVAITGCELTTNEAIAHFRMEDSTIREYLYFYLKHFNYQTMGSTSSIATAVNSKMVKAMRIDIPARETLENFHSTVFPMFEQIKQNQQEIQTLAQLRDTLLPKLMSGELDVSEVEV